MATSPKSIGVAQLSGAVQKAVAGVKAPAGSTGPYAYINPGIICGIIWYGPGVEFEGATTAAKTIATAVSTHLGETVAGVVQANPAGALGAHALPSKYIICGFKLPPDAHVHF